jgi:two-component system OmpR family response regulator
VLLDRGTTCTHDASMHILLVEDDVKLGPLIVRLLAAERHTVELAATGVDGIAFWESKRWDLVILDRMLPDLEGASILRDRRRAGDTTPVLMLTAMGTVDDRVEGLDSGADDYLTKPFAASELLARVRALGRRSEFAAGGPVSRVIVAGLELDESRHALTYAGQVIDLSAREYALLAHLMRNRGSALTRQQLLDEVWGAEPDVYSNVVDLYIHYLREKFKDAGHDDLIKTVRGVGYRLIEAEAS